MKAMQEEHSSVLFLLWDRVGERVMERPPRHVAELLRYVQSELDVLRMRFRPHNPLTWDGR